MKNKIVSAISAFLIIGLIGVSVAQAAVTSPNASATGVTKAAAAGTKAPIVTKKVMKKAAPKVAKAKAKAKAKVSKAAKVKVTKVTKKAAQAAKKVVIAPKKGVPTIKR